MIRRRRLSSWSLATAFASMAAVLLAQTPVEPPKNKYSLEQDVQLGLEAAREAERELPILRDELVSGYVEDLGRRLTRVIPKRFDYPQFSYTFTTVNVREINAFALPGGPMFVNRGMIEAADREGEVVGVMAHELSHVLLRHGTAQATKAQGFQLGAMAGAIAGAVIGGTAGQIVSEGSQFGLGTAFLKYSREYERQADILGAQLMAKAGYDARDLAAMFDIIARQGGSGGPAWLSSHPNPGNRSTYIQQEAAALSVKNPIKESREFDRVRARLSQMSPAPTSEEAARRPRSGESTGGTRPISETVERPSTQFRAVRGGDIFEASVPVNWHEFSSSNTIKYGPDGGYGNLGRQTVFTHGVEFGMFRSSTRDLRSATDDLLNEFGQGNPELRVEGNAQESRLSGRRALISSLSNVSEVTHKEERLSVTTTFLADGSLFYCMTVAPDREAGQYQSTFDRVVRSVTLRR